MNRLELLDQVYELAEPGNKLLLCIMASSWPSRAAVHGIEQNP